jgi:small subunit ribosomal protein S17
MGRRKILEGVVISDKMNKTRVVLVAKRVPHLLYKKMVTKRKKYKVHDEENKSKVGDKVKIIESRPYSKEKRFKLLEVLK